MKGWQWGKIRTSFTFFIFLMTSPKIQMGWTLVLYWNLLWKLPLFFCEKCTVSWSKWRTFSNMHEIYCFKCYRDCNEGLSWVFIQTIVFYPCFCLLWADKLAQLFHTNPGMEQPSPALKPQQWGRWFGGGWWAWREIVLPRQLLTRRAQWPLTLPALPDVAPKQTAIKGSPGQCQALVSNQCGFFNL